MNSSVTNYETKRPQANVIHKRIHQMLDNIIRSSNKINLDDKNPRVELHQLQCIAILSNYTTIQATPAQLVFGRVAIL